ncbi:MAG: WXG100 family type VII secretion target [Lachnospiraceae bacterium]|jgi:uncharacterized protein YukE|nr:WXG100 family type VII secretion target [Lachnospiraceae bacterium]
MAGIVLSVKPEELEAEVENMRGYLRTLKVHFDAISDTMKNTGNYWRGDAGDADRSEFAAAARTFESIYLNLAKQPDKLLQIAGIYKGTESRIDSMSDMLRTDFFV